MTVTIPPPPPTTRHDLGTLTAGLVGGLALGAIARMWMRFISTDPEFTWSGTLFIVLGFGVFGTTQALGTIVRRRARRAWPVRIARAIGGVGSLPLFVAAGGMMFPTVLAGSFAAWQSERKPWVRALSALVALLPVLLVGSQLVSDFGWSLRTAAGMVGLIAIYATIIRATRPTYTRQPQDQRLPRWARWLVLAVLVVAFLVPLGIGGIH